MTGAQIAIWIARKLLEMLKAPAGGTATSIELGSGYSTEEDRRMKREDLENLLEEIVADPTLFQDEADKHTHCNIAIARICEHFSYEFERNSMGDLPLANEMIGILQGDTDRWRMDSGIRAADHAMKGGLAIAAKKAEGHGHVAAVAPRAMELSGSLGFEVPIVANVGRGPSKFVKVSGAFPVAEGEPLYFLLDPDEIA